MNVAIDKRISLLIPVISIFLSGCLESSFRMSEDSSFPIWLDVSDNEIHGNLLVTLDYYTNKKAVFSLIRRSDGELLDKVVTRVRDNKPLEEDGTSWPVGTYPTYPIYTIATHEGISEIIEHSESGPMFSMYDSGVVIENVGCRAREAGGLICEQDFILRKE